jgi:ubiquitin thioesterase ZRANB1
MIAFLQHRVLLVLNPKLKKILLLLIKYNLELINFLIITKPVFLHIEIEDLPPATQEQLYSELMDRDAQKELEDDVEGHSGCSLSSNTDQSLNSAINWSVEIRSRLGSRLYALWNRSAGDCLLDSVLQATWGVFDRDNTLRRAMAESLHEAGQM